MGPASLSQHYEVGPDGLIVADIQFSTGKPRYSVEEVLALRDAVLAAYRQDMIQILFDQRGAKLLAAGKAREALAADRALIEQHPHEGLAHAQMSYALLKAGMGQKARSEAEQAVALNPKSAVSFKALGWVCQFNAIGVEHGSGFDWDCASAAYKKAMALDPNDNSTLIDLAILDEYDHDGARYSSGAPLSDGIRLFRSLIEKDKEASEPYRDNLLFDLLYNHQYKDLLKELSDLPSSVSRDALGISATVALEPGTKGIADGIARADHLTSGVARRNSALTSASSQLLYLRMYPEAAEMLAASTEGQTDSAGNTQRIGILRQLRPWNGDYLPATDARGVVQHLMLGFISGQISGKSAEDLLDRHAYGSEVEWQRNTEKYLLSRSLLRTMSKNSDLPASALLDLIAGNLKLSSDGDQASGYKVSMQSIGSKAQSYFVVSEEGKLKIVTEGTSPSEAGNEALYLLNAGRDREARALLDWMRDRVHKGGGDDPLSGPLLPRFWSVGDAPDHKAMVRAAASLVTGNVGIREVLPAIRADWDRAATDQERLGRYSYLGLPLAVQGRTKEARPIAEGR
jgi:tetratricopeptide (TPR) repeat protein